MPLIIFIALIHLMDSYRVFEEVVGFSPAGPCDLAAMADLSTS
jgi:hypothetical protein